MDRKVEKKREGERELNVDYEAQFDDTCVVHYWSAHRSSFIF